MNSLNVRKHKHGGKRHMEYTKLGNTDIEVSKLCVGCMSFGKAGTMHDWTLDKTIVSKKIMACKTPSDLL